MPVVWRVQNGEGRGPYKPGLSEQWSDGNSGRDCVPWWIELGLPMVAAHDSLRGNMHTGCAFETKEKAKEWFSRSELRRLSKLGYRLVQINVDAIRYRTPTQLVVQSITPLSQCVVEDRVIT